MTTTNAVTEVIEDSAILGGVIVSLQDIQSILSISLLVFNILWLVGKFTIKFFRYIKDGKLIDEEKEDLKADYEVIDDLVDKIGDDKNGNK